MKIMRMIKLGSAVALLGLCLAPSWAHASSNTVVNVNFTDTPSQFLDGNTWVTGTTTNAPLAYTGTVWTDLTSGPNFTASNLPNSDGTSSGVGFTTTAVGYDGSFVPGPLKMQQGGAYGPPLTLTLTGLAPTDYNLYLASNHRINVVAGGVFTIGSQSLTSTSGQWAYWEEGVNYVAFFNLTPDINNQIVVNVIAAPGDSYAALNGFQLEVLPEPSSVLLLGVGGLLVWRRRLG